jgi:hypothetical protein
MKRIVFVLATLLSVCLVSAQQNYHQKANYDLASRFSPKRLEKMIFSTSVDPHWTKSGNKFWYMYETTAGKKWMVIDPVKMTKTPMFDNDKLAANLTRIVKDPFDGKHLAIENLKFVRDDNWIRFEVKSSLEVEKKDSTKKGNAAKEKKVFYWLSSKTTRSQSPSLHGPMFLQIKNGLCMQRASTFIAWIQPI